MKIKQATPHGEQGHFCHGGCAGFAKGGKVTAGVDGVQKNPHPEPIPEEHGTAGVGGLMQYGEGGVVTGEEEAEIGETREEKTDPSDIPEEIQEYVEKAHKAIRESRPDEGWRNVRAERPDSIAPYKQDDESEAETMPDEDGLMNFAEGGQVPDPTAIMQELAPPGSGILAPSPSMQMPKAPPVTSIAPPPPQDAMMPKAPMAPQSTDDDYMTKANKILGLNPQEQAGFMKLLGGNAQKAQIGAGIAGIGDAIASGGTLGKVNPGALNKSEELINNRTMEGLQGMQTIRENQGKSQELADKLEARDPKSPLSRWAQKAYAGVGKKIGLDLSNASASVIADVSGKGVDALNTEFQNQLKMMGVDLQKKTLDATVANQKAEREIAKEGHQADAAKALGGKGFWSTVGGIVTPSGREATRVLEATAKGQQANGPYGSETIRDGKTYVWSPETGKYHKK